MRHVWSLEIKTPKGSISNAIVGTWVCIGLYTTYKQVKYEYKCYGLVHHNRKRIVKYSRVKNR